MAGTKVKTKVGNLKYCFIKGEGKNKEIDKNVLPNMCYTATVVFKENSKEHLAIVEELTEVWEEYKKVQTLAKGTLKTSSIKIETMKDPDGTIDPNTDEIARVPTGNVLVTMYTKTAWADGNPKIVKKFDGKGNDITAAYDNEDFSIGDGSTGILHGRAVGNIGGGSAKITLYLSAVQLGHLVRYEGDTVDTEDIGEELDMGDSVSSIPTDTTEV